MKTFLALFTLAASMLGCSALPPDTILDAGETAPSPFPPNPFPPEPAGRLMLVVPATGGPPIHALSLGGGLYAPVSGGPPTVGTPLAP